jgi:hypothetical protein
VTRAVDTVRLSLSCGDARRVPGLLLQSECTVGESEVIIAFTVGALKVTVVNDVTPYSLVEEPAKLSLILVTSFETSVDFQLATLSCNQDGTTRNIAPTRLHRVITQKQVLTSPAARVGQCDDLPVIQDPQRVAGTSE